MSELPKGPGEPGAVPLPLATVEDRVLMMLEFNRLVGKVVANLERRAAAQAADPNGVRPAMYLTGEHVARIAGRDVVYSLVVAAKEPPPAPEDPEVAEVAEVAPPPPEAPA